MTALLSNEHPYAERKILSAMGIWPRVEVMPSGCWEWRGMSAEGYGRVQISKQNFLVHRLIAEIFHRPLLDGELACHSCANKACCNPRHINIGTDLDNSHDAIQAAGRAVPTKRCRVPRPLRPSTKPLTEKQRAVLDYVNSFFSEAGFPPTTREIQARFGFRSQTASVNYLKILRSKGCLSWVSGKSRTIVIKKAVAVGANDSNELCGGLK